MKWKEKITKALMLKGFLVHEILAPTPPRNSEGYFYCAEISLIQDNDSKEIYIGLTQKEAFSVVRSEEIQLRYKKEKFLRKGKNNLVLLPKMQYDIIQYCIENNVQEFHYPIALKFAHHLRKPLSGSMEQKYKLFCFKSLKVLEAPQLINYSYRNDSRGSFLVSNLVFEQDFGLV